MKNQYVKEGELMSPHERRKWIMRWFLAMSERHTHTGYMTGTTDRDFSDEYILATRAPYIPTMIGANVCPMLAKDLKYLFDSGKLKRYTIGIGDGLSSMGFPKWTWAYKL